MSYMFYNCGSLKNVDVSSFLIENNIYLFNNLPSNCQIKIHSKALNKIKNITNTCKIFY